MKHGLHTSGRVASGAGAAGAATSLDWFRVTVQREYAFEPVAGTLNVTLDGDWRAVEHQLLTAGTVLVPPSADYCAAILLGARVGTARKAVPAVVLRPLVPGYDPARLEFLAPVHLRSELGLQDGDQLQIELEGCAPGRSWVTAAAEGAPAGSQQPLSGLRVGQAGLTVDLTIGPLACWVTWSITDQGISLSLFGGVPHVGATALAVPRPSLRDPGRRSATSSVLTVSGHKDDLLARQVAESLAAGLNRVAAVTVGIHAGPEGAYDLPPADMERILGIVGRVGEIVKMSVMAAEPAVNKA